MIVKDTELDALRREIDEIDARILEAIVARTAVVRRVGEVKGGGPILRPGREAKVMRALLAGADTGLPLPVVGRIWRELIAAYCRLQGKLVVAVCAPEKSVGYWDLARDHFGSATRMSLHKSPTVVLRAVSEGDATVGILPLPQDGEADPWWRYMSGGADNIPRVIGRLPFVGNPSAQFGDFQAVVVACLPFDGSDDDVSWLVVTTSEQVSRRSLTDHLTAVDFGGRSITSFSGGGTGNAHLFEVDGYVMPDDARLKEFAERVGGNARLSTVGSFARPFWRT
jgi:chorismate mutase/prephenate dehydratase